MANGEGHLHKTDNVHSGTLRQRLVGYRVAEQRDRNPKSTSERGAFDRAGVVGHWPLLPAKTSTPEFGTLYKNLARRLN